MPKINAQGHATYAENVLPEGADIEREPFHEPPPDAPATDATRAEPLDEPDEKDGDQPSVGSSSRASSRKPASSATKR